MRLSLRAKTLARYYTPPLYSMPTSRPFTRRSEERPATIKRSRAAKSVHPLVKRKVALVVDALRRARGRALPESIQRTVDLFFGIQGMAKVEIDPSTQAILRADEAMCSLLKYTEEELLSVTEPALVLGSERDLTLQNLASARDGTALRTLRRRYVRRDGSIVEADVSPTLIFGGRGKVVRVLAMVQDVTEWVAAKLERERLDRALREFAESARMQSEEALYQGEERLRAVIAERDREAEARAQALRALAQSEQRVDALTVARDREAEARAQAEEAARQSEERCHSLVGIERAVTETLKAQLAREILERKRAEEEIRTRSEQLERTVAARTQELEAAQERDRTNLQRLTGTISSMPMAAATTDENLTILHANQKFCHLLNCGDDSLSVIGTSAMDTLIQAKDLFVEPERYAEEMRSTLESKVATFDRELTMGSGVILSCDAIPTFEKDAHRGYLLLFRDSTREKRIDRAKSEFMSLASHQLRTPLTSIRWTICKLIRSLEHRANVLEEKLLREGKLATVRMSETIDTMLRISRIEAGSIQIDWQIVALRPLLEDLSILHQEQYRRKRQTFAIGCAYNLMLKTDPRFLREVIGNLLSNAIEYTPDHGSITIQAIPLDRGVQISVQDTGYGISLEQQPKIFSKFFRGDNILSRETQGTGLGLYLASLMTEVLGGRLSFRSREGAGTTFTLLLPSSL